MNRIKTIIKYNKKEKIAKLLVVLEKRHLKQEQQIKALEDKAREIVEMYILTTPTDKESGATMVVSKLAKPIIEMNELLNKHQKMKVYKDTLGFAKVEDKNGLEYHISTTLHDEIKETKQQIKELKELLKVSICPNKRCVDGAIEVGDYIEHGIEQCQFCDNKEQALKK